MLMAKLRILDFGCFQRFYLTLNQKPVEMQHYYTSHIYSWRCYKIFRRVSMDGSGEDGIGESKSS